MRTLSDGIWTWYRELAANDRASYLVCLALLLLAYGFDLTEFTFYSDDFFYSGPTYREKWVHHMVEQGRWGFGLYVHLVQGKLVPFFGWGVALLLLPAAGILISRLWHVKDPLTTGLVTVAVAVSPPFIEVSNFNQSVAPFFTGVFLTALGLHLAARPSVRAGSAAVLSLCVGLSFYQGVSVACVLLFIGQLPLKAVRAASWNDFATYARSTLRRQGVILLVGITLYACVTLLLFATTSFAPTERLAAGTAGEYKLLKGLVLWPLAVWRTYFAGAGPYLPIETSRMILVVALTGLIGGVLAVRRNASSGLGALLLVLCAGLAAVSILAVTHTFLISAGVPDRAKSYFGYYVAFFIALARPSVPLVSNLSFAASTVLSVMLIWSANVNFFYIWENNLAFFHTANRIVARIEGLPQYDQFKRWSLIIEGRLEYPNTRGQLRIPGPERFDAGKVFKALCLLGVQVEPTRLEDFPDSVLDRLAAAPEWPAPGSVFIQDGAVGVKLPPPWAYADRMR